MRLSTVFELLLIFLLIAFAAYARVIDRDEATLRRAVRAVVNTTKESNLGVTTISLKQATDNVNKYCTCNENICNCCRNFDIPLVQLKGPGCASLQYLQGDDLAVQLSFGDNILTSTVVSGKSPKPVCVPLPGGFSKFCGRIYSIQREANKHFKACLGLELQSSTEVEASLRVSCFRFGPDGLKLRPAEPLPVVESDSSADDDDDDEDIFGLGGDDDDDDDDDDDEDTEEEPAEANAVPSSSSNDESEDDDDDDVLGLGALFDIFSGEDDTTTKKPKATTPLPIPQFTIPIITKPNSEETPQPENAPKPETVSQDDQAVTNSQNVNTETVQEITHDEAQTDTESTVGVTNVPEKDNDVAGSSNQEVVLEPPKASSTPLKKVTGYKKKPASANTIKDDIKKKPLGKPGKPDPVKNDQQASSNEQEQDDEEDDDEDDILGAADLDDDDDDEDDKDDKDDKDHEDDEDDEDEKEDVETDDAEEEDDDDEEKEEEDEQKVQENNKDKLTDEADDDEKNDELEVNENDDDDDDDDDDDEEEDALLAALAEDDKGKAKKDKIQDNEAENPEEDDADYGFGLAEFLARKRSSRSGRQSRVMRL